MDTPGASKNMPYRPFAHLFRQIRRLAGVRNAETIGDAALLERFVYQRDEAAFELLVHRYAPLVLGLCRRVLRDVHAADDAFQATFLILARKAGTIRRPNFLGSWLYKVALRAALEAKSRDAQRRTHEWPAGDLQGGGTSDDEATPTREKVAWAAAEDPATADPAAEAAWHELQPVLDDELQRLPEKYRVPLILCCLQGMTNEEAAAQLSWPTGTVKGRLARARDLLRNRLDRRGVALSTGFLTALLAQNATAATPRLLVNVTTQTALAFEAGQTALLAPQVAVLTKSVLHGIAIGRLKVAAAVVLALCVAGGAIGAGVVAAWPRANVSVSAPAPQAHLSSSLGGWRPFPDDNAWNEVIAAAPVDPNSDTLIASIGLDKPLHANFGAWKDGEPWGIPYVVVSGSQPRVPIRLVGDTDESDPGPYPIPPDAPIEGNPKFDLRRVVVIDRDNGKLYEFNGAYREGRRWRANYAATFDLTSNRLRPEGWTSADGAGLPIFPGLVRYDEVLEQCVIRHALRFTVSKTRRAFVHPARHFASTAKDPDLPPMGMRVRLKADYDISGFPPSIQVILTALKQYGMFVAEHGEDWSLSGAPDSRWDDADLQTLARVKGRDFEVVRLGKLTTRVK
jgi:RNA polymerase sigma factor (sigma-70 family)